jgi:hypothetical protein
MTTKAVLWQDWVPGPSTGGHAAAALLVRDCRGTPLGRAAPDARFGLRVTRADARQPIDAVSVARADPRCRARLYGRGSLEQHFPRPGWAFGIVP